MRRLLWAVAVVLSLSGPVLAAEPGHVTGIGGVFVKSKDPKALRAWYRDVLGISFEKWGGAKLAYDAPGHPPLALWAAFPESSDQMAPSTQPFMLNFAVDDMDAMIRRLDAKGVTIIHKIDDDPNGRFVTVLDPDGTKIELWQPKAK